MKARSKMTMVAQSWAMVITAALLVGSAAAEIYKIENLATGSSLGGKGGGQTFTPSDAPGYAGEASLALTSFTMWRGGANNSATETSTTTFLVIYEGDPDSSTQVGASVTSVDTENTGPGTRYDWEFDHLVLEPNTQYWAVLSNSPVDDNVLQSAGGTWLQMSLQTSSENYGGTDEWSLIANRDPHNAADKPDLRFSATFDTTLTPGLEIVSGDGLFGELFHAGPASATSRTFAVRNAVDGVPLTLGSVALAPGADPVFSVSGAPAPGTIIQPGDEFEIVMTVTGGGGGTPLADEVLIDVDAEGYDRRFPVEAVVLTTGDEFPLLRNGGFELQQGSWSGTADSVAGLAGGTAVRLRGDGDDRTNPSVSSSDLLGQAFTYGNPRDFTIRFSLVIPDFQSFVGLTPDAGYLDRSFQFALMSGDSIPGNGVFGDNEAARALVNLVYMADGVPGDPGEGFFVYDGTAGSFERLAGLGLLQGSTGFSETGALPSTVFAYQLSLSAHGFGTPSASYDISISQPNSAETAATVTGLTTWHAMDPQAHVPQSLLFTTRDSSADGTGAFAPVQPSFWIDDVSASLAETLPLALLEIVDAPGTLRMADHSRESVSFVLRNAGIGSDLVIDSWSPTDPLLAVVSPASSPLVIPAGQSSEIVVQVNALEVAGDLQFQESLEVASNDPVAPIASLPVLAEVLAGGKRVLVDFDDGIPGNGVHDASLRNGGFEDGDADQSFIDAPEWFSRYTPEADEELLVSANAPGGGSLHGLAGGEQGSGTRAHPAQTFGFEDWTISEGDTFRVDVKWKADSPLAGGGGLQLRILVLDADGNTIPSPSGKGWSNSPRLISSTAPLQVPGVYQTDTFVTEPVPAGDPWIGGRLMLWFLNTGNRDEFVAIDDVRMVGSLRDPELQLSAWSIDPGSGQVSLRWADIGRRYRIQGSSSLNFSSPSFTTDVNEGNGMVLDGGDVLFEFYDPTSAAARFWRVVTY